MKVIACGIRVPLMSYDIFHLQLAMNASFKCEKNLSDKCIFYQNVIRLLYSRLFMELYN